MMNLLIRADANPQIGTGHVMRCLALAQAWQAEGNRAFFLSHCESEALRQRIEGTGFGFVSVEREHPNPTDLDTTLKLAKDLQAIWVVLDGYHFDPTYQQAVRAAGYRLLVIDDIAHWSEYHTDILLNQNINAAQLAYRCDLDTTLLLGIRYVLLRQEFLTWRGWKRRIPQVARKMLVTFGGGDPDNVALKIIQVLQQVDVTDLEARIVVGPANLHLEILRRAVQDSTRNVQLLTDVTNMPELMAWADLAISAGGSTCWELAFMGVPTVVLVLAANQRGVAEGLERAGMVINLGWFDRVSSHETAYAVDNLLGAHRQRQRVSHAGRELVDGNGGIRVVKTMSTLNNINSLDRLKTRLATMQDAVSLWELANNTTVRMNSFNPDPIPFDYHLEWCQSKLSSHNTRIWVLELDGNVVAQIRYDHIDSDIADIDFTVAPPFRGRGLGTKVLILTCLPACEELGVKRLRGVAFDSNLPSARAFLKAGFKQIVNAEQVHGRSCSIFEWSCKGKA